MKTLSVSAKRIRGHITVTMEARKLCECGREMLLSIRDGKVSERCSGGAQCKKR